jgi:hypothetical protein
VSGSRRARNKQAEARARQTQVEQREAEKRKQITLRQYRMRRAAGWSLVGLGVLIGVTHWLTHLQVIPVPSQGVADLVAGYPMAALIVIAGSIVLSKA